MIIDTAAIRRKNRRTQQMVCIHEHGSKHDEISLLPIFPEKYIRQNQRKEKVQPVMDDVLEGKNIGKIHKSAQYERQIVMFELNFERIKLRSISIIKVLQIPDCGGA